MRCACWLAVRAGRFYDPHLAERSAKTLAGVQVKDRALRQGLEPAARRLDVRLRNRRQRRRRPHGRRQLADLAACRRIGFVRAGRPVYLNTRVSLSSQTIRTTSAENTRPGLGSPHTPKGWVWPLGLIGEALTTPNLGQVTESSCKRIATTSGSDRLMHGLRPERSDAIHATGVRLGECGIRRAAVQICGRFSVTADALGIAAAAPAARRPHSGGHLAARSARAARDDDPSAEDQRLERAAILLHPLEASLIMAVARSGPRRDPARRSYGSPISPTRRARRTIG